jgi:hypothetical protein
LESSKVEELRNKIECERRERRVEDELRLRELELQTSFQVRTLSESLEWLKNDFHSWRETMNISLVDVRSQVDKLRLQGVIVIGLLLSQLAGAEKLIGQLIKGVGGF